MSERCDKRPLFIKLTLRKIIFVYILFIYTHTLKKIFSISVSTWYVQVFKNSCFSDDFCSEHCLSRASTQALFLMLTGGMFLYFGGAFLAGNNLQFLCTALTLEFLVLLYLPCLQRPRASSTCSSCLLRLLFLYRPFHRAV